MRSLKDHIPVWAAAVFLGLAAHLLCVAARALIGLPTYPLRPYGPLATTLILLQVYFPRRSL